MICEIRPQPHTHTGRYSWALTCMRARLFSRTISMHHNATSNNRIKPLCFGWDDGISISANLVWLIHSSNPECWLCKLRWLSAILATYHHTGINRNIFSNYRNAAVLGAVNYFNVCQTIIGYRSPPCCPTVKHRNLPLISMRQYTQHFISFLFRMMAEVIDLHKGSILSLGEKRRRQ